LVYAKVLMEISPTKKLPSLIKVGVAEGVEAEVSVSYSWKPDIFDTCQTFGHLVETCPKSINVSLVPFEDRVPLPRPSMRCVPKVPVAFPPGPPSISGVVSNAGMDVLLPGSSQTPFIINSGGIVVAYIHVIVQKLFLLNLYHGTFLSELGFITHPT